jgi:hypothetical protein
MDRTTTFWFLRNNKQGEHIMKSAIFALTFFSLTLPAFGQGVDPLIGTWKLNVAKSTGALVRSQTLTWTMEGQTLTNTAETVDAQGQPLPKAVFIHIYDGKRHPTTGNPNFDSTAYTRMGNVISILRFKNGKPVLVGQAVIDPGKTYTLVQGGIDLNNQPGYAILVYDRQ